MNSPTFKQRFQYWFDNYMSRGTIALIGGLAVLSLVIIFIAATVVRIGNYGPDLICHFPQKRFP